MNNDNIRNAYDAMSPSELAKARYLAAKLVDIFHIEISACFLSHSQQVEHGIGATAHCNIKSHCI